MIFDNIKNISKYRALGKNYEKAIDWLEKIDIDSIENGKYEIDDNNVFASVMSYETIDYVKGKFESHKNYTDLQLVVSGREAIWYMPVESLDIKTSYDDKKDIIIYEKSDKARQIALRDRDFCIFNSWDGHMPKIEFEGACLVKKIVVKIKGDLDK